MALTIPLTIGAAAAGLPLVRMANDRNPIASCSCCWVERRPLLERQQVPILDENFGTPLPIRRRVAHIVDDPDDLYPGRWALSDMPVDKLADRARRPKGPPGNASADYNHGRRAGCVGRLEVAAVEQVGAHRGQVAGTDRSNQRPYRTSAHLVHRPARRHERPDGEGFANENAGASEPGGLDIWSCP